MDNARMIISGSDELIEECVDRTKEELDIFGRVVWGTRWIWHDVITCLDYPGYETFLALPEKEQQEIVNEYEHIVAERFKNEIMEYWASAMETAIRETGLLSAIKGVETKRRKNR